MSITWAGEGTGDTQGVFAQRYDMDGNKVGSEFKVNSTTTNAQTEPSVAMDPNGNFVIAWTSDLQDGSGLGVYAQRYNSAGVAQGGQIQLHTTTASDQEVPMLAMDASGNFVAVWQTNLQDGSGYGIAGQRFNASGVKQGSEFIVNVTTAGDQWLDSLAMDASGDFVVTYSGALDGSGDGVFMRRYAANGTALSGEVRVNTTTANNQNWSSIGMAADGTFVIAWDSNLQDGTLGGIYAQRFDAAGVAQGSEFRVNTTTAGDQGRPVVSLDGGGTSASPGSARGRTDQAGVSTSRTTAPTALPSAARPASTRPQPTTRPTPRWQ